MLCQSDITNTKLNTPWLTECMPRAKGKEKVGKW